MAIHQNKKSIDIQYDVTPHNISEALLNSDVPVVLKNYGGGWPLVNESKKSTQHAIDYLKRMDSGLAVNACYLEPKERGRIFYNEDMSGFNFATKQQTLSTVLTELQAESSKNSGKTIYVGSTSIYQVLPDLVEKTPSSPFITQAIYNLWLGNQSKVAAHFDFLQNLACCVVGRRRFTLFPPEQVKNLYCGPIDKAPGGQAISMVDLDNPDFNKFPKFEEALNASITIELEAGDAILLPSMWWHYVEGLDDLNVLLNHWWKNSPAYMGNPSDALQHAMLSIRDLPKAQRNAWQHMFNHYVFNHDVEQFNYIPPSSQSMLASPMSELEARKLRANLQNKLRR